MIIKIPSRVWLLALLTSCHGWVYSDTPANIEKDLEDKAKAIHPNIKIIKPFTPTDNSNQARILYKVPPDKTIYSMTINSKTGKIIQDHAYKEPEKASLFDLNALKKQLEQKYAIQKINKTALTYNSEKRLIRTVYGVDKHKQQRTIITDAFTGQVIETKRNRP